VDKAKEILQDIVNKINDLLKGILKDKDKGLLWLGPICVLAFVLILTVMYGWVGNIENTGAERPEMSEMNLVNQVQVPQAGQQGQAGQLVHHGTFPVGIGNSQMQLINKPIFPLGIGNGQMQLINEPKYPVGIGNSQIRLIGLNQFGPYLGLSLGDVPDFVAKDLKIKADAGVYVKKVMPASPAEKAGLKGGDILLKCDHKKVNSHAQVGKILAAKKIGDVIKLLVNRNGRKKSFHVKLEKIPDNLMTVAATTTSPTWMGADIQDIDAVMKLRFNLPDKRGVIVSYVAGKSPAQTAGIQASDVIRRFGETRIRNVSQFKSLILKGQPGQQVQLTILRNGQHLTLPVVLGQMAHGTGKTPFIAPADMAIEGSWIGMDVSELSAGGASALGLPAGTTGIMVGDVESPPAITVGFQAGDVIVGVNGMPTPDMKSFVTATRKQSSAVVDVLRGNKHLYISVPPPGFTRQMTKINTGTRNMKQVAMTLPSRGMLAIFATGPELSATVAGNTAASPYMILVDLNNNRFAALGTNSASALANTVSHYGISGLICRDLSPQSASVLAAGGVSVYSGVVGTANDAIGLYESGSLIAMNR
jgi:S1-C subfamily serine protease/predicted Fe-Mo cluster-binding NifX family protein